MARAYHEAVTADGPTLVIVPMDDWSAEANPADERAAPSRVVRARRADAAAVGELAGLLAGAKSPALVVGAGADDPDTWRALVSLAERLGCPVWQESFSARAGFPQDHRLFAGHLPADRTRLRRLLAPHDVVLAVGAPTFRQYPFHPGPFVEPGTRVAMVSQDAAEVHRSAAELAVLADPASICAELARTVSARGGTSPAPFAPPAPPAPPAEGRAAPCRARVRGPRRAPAAQRPRHRGVPVEPARVAAAPAGARAARLPEPRPGRARIRSARRDGVRMARPDRPVVAIVGDGSSLYSIQALWSAAHYGAGALFVILSNGGYAIMDRLAEQHGGAAPWPGFGVDVAGLARAFGCPARTVAEHGELLEALDEVVPGLADRDEPLLLEVTVAPDESFAP